MVNSEVSTFVIVLGIAALLVGLILLIVCAKILSRLNRSGEGRSSASVSESAAGVFAASETAPATADDTLIAVLSAAVAAYMGSDHKPVIRSVRPVARQASVWAMAGRRDLM